MKKQSMKSFESQTTILTLEQQKQVKGGLERGGINNANSGRSNLAD